MNSNNRLAFRLFSIASIAVASVTIFCSCSRKIHNNAPSNLYRGTSSNSAVGMGAPLEIDSVINAGNMDKTIEILGRPHDFGGGPADDVLRAFYYIKPIRVQIDYYQDSGHIATIYISNLTSAENLSFDQLAEFAGVKADSPTYSLIKLDIGDSGRSGVCIELGKDRDSATEERNTSGNYSSEKAGQLITHSGRCSGGELLIEKLVDQGQPVTVNVLFEAHYAFERICDLEKHAVPCIMNHLNDKRRALMMGGGMRGAVSSVGDRCYDALTKIICTHGKGYKRRKGADGKFHECPTYLDNIMTIDGRFERNNFRIWWSQNEHRTIEEIQIEALNWKIAKESEIGFPDIGSRRRYLSYLEERLKLMEASIHYDSEFGDLDGF